MNNKQELGEKLDRFNVSISIVILTYNRKELLEKLLYSLIALNKFDLEIIVVDNHSEDGTDKLLKESFIHCISIRTEKNIGAVARNLGIRRARGEIIICLDDDVFGIDIEAIYTLEKIFYNNPKFAAVNFKVLDYYSGEICNWVHHCKAEEYCERTFKTYEITEGAVAFRRLALDMTSLYPMYFFISHEGLDLAFRLMDKGFDIIYTGDIAVQHCHSNLGRKVWTTYYYDSRNQLWIAVRNLPLIYALKYLIRGLISTLIYSLRDGYFRYWLKAIKDGIVGFPLAWKDRKIVSRNTIDVIKKIDKMRPSVWYLIKNRLFHKGMRL